MKIALKWIRTDIAHGRVKPTLNNENKLVELYLKKLRGTVAKKYFSEDAWDYACGYFGI
jgi:hypothetical protein